MHRLVVADTNDRTFTVEDRRAVGRDLDRCSALRAERRANLAHAALAQQAAAELVPRKTRLVDESYVVTHPGQQHGGRCARGTRADDDHLVVAVSGGRHGSNLAERGAPSLEEVWRARGEGVAFGPASSG